jgi:hypothetical protein
VSKRNCSSGSASSSQVANRFQVLDVTDDNDEDEDDSEDDEDDEDYY